MQSFIKYYTLLQEALTIPENPFDEIEMELRDKLENGYSHSDRIIRWYRNALKSGESKSDVKKEFVDNLGNIKDLFKTYDSYLLNLRKMKLLGKKIGIEVQGGKIIEVDPEKDVDRIRKLIGFKALVSKMGEIIHSDTTIDSGNEKYQITDEDRKKIKLLGSSANVMLWETSGYETTNKFIFQLWQNAKTLGRGDVYGDPSEQTPYCTHSKQHWDSYSEDFGDKYKQFWFLKKVDGVSYSSGDLSNSSVVIVFNAMKGLGPKIIIAMNDSGNDMLDRKDNKVALWENALKYKNSKDISRQLDYADEILKLQLKFAPPRVQKHYQWEIPGKIVCGGENGVILGDENEYLDPPKIYNTDTFTIQDNDYISQGFKTPKQYCDFINEIKFPQEIHAEESVIIDGRKLSLQYPPNKIFAKQAIALNKLINIANKIELECPYLKLNTVSQDVCDKLLFNNIEGCVLNHTYINNLRFLPNDFNIQKLALYYSTINDFEGAPINIKEFIPNPISEETKTLNEKEYHLFMTIKSVGFPIVLNHWIKNKRFHSLLNDSSINLSRQEYLYTLAFLNYVIKQHNINKNEGCVEYYYNRMILLLQGRRGFFDDSIAGKINLEDAVSFKDKIINFLNK